MVLSHGNISLADGEKKDAGMSLILTSGHHTPRMHLAPLDTEAVAQMRD